MKTITSILVALVSVVTFGQHEMKLTVYPGDHVYILDTPASVPVHYQLTAASRDSLLAKCDALGQYHNPTCEFVFDPKNYENIILRQEDGKYYVEALSVYSQRGLYAINKNHNTQPIFQDGEIVFTDNRFLMIYTPYLSRATSFKISTNHRVLLLINQYLTITKL